MKLYIKDLEIKNADQIIIIIDGKQIINPSEDEIINAGWEIYVPNLQEMVKLNPNKYDIQYAIMVMMAKKLVEAIKAEFKTLSDLDALEVKSLADTWISKVNTEVQQGDRLYYNDKLYKVRQTHTVLEVNPPSIDTASLYEEISIAHQGTKEDPIPYNNNMRLELGKHYMLNDVIYKCIRDTEIAVYQNLSDLVNIYVNKL